MSLVDLWVLLINNFEKVHLINSEPIIRPLQHLRCHKEIHYRCCKGLDTPLKLLTTKNLKMTKSYYFKIMSTTKRTSKATFRGQFSAGYFPGAWGRWAFFSDTLIKNVSEYFSKKIHGSSCGNQLLKVLKFQVYFLNPLSANPTKWLNTLKQFVSISRRIECVWSFCGVVA